MTPRTRSTGVAAACARALDFARRCESPGGGFSSRPGDEPTLCDTFHALRLLRLLGHETPLMQLSSAFAQRAAHRMRILDLFYLTGIEIAIGAAYVTGKALLQRIRSSEFRIPAPDAGSALLTPWPARSRTIAHLRRRFDDGLSQGQLRQWRTLIEGLARDGGFGPGPNLLDTAMAVEILAVCGGKAQVPGLLDYVKAVQSPKLAFAATPDSDMARLELVAAGVSCCAALRTDIRYPDEALSFILDCEVEDGGFASRPGALPEIELTFLAIDSLLVLSNDVAIRVPKPVSSPRRRADGGPFTLDDNADSRWPIQASVAASAAPVAPASCSPNAP